MTTMVPNILNKVTHLINFEKNKATDNDPFANNVLMNMRPSVRDTSQDQYANFVALNLRFYDPLGTNFYIDDCGGAIALSSNSLVQSSTTRGNRYTPYFAGYYISVPHDVNLGLCPTASAFTIEFWIQFTSTSMGSAIAIMGKRNATGYGPWVIIKDVNDKIVFYSSNTALTAWAITFSSTTTIQAGQWYHVAFVRSGTIYSLYINGTLDNQVSSTTAWPTSTDSLYIGMTSNSQYPLYGYMNDIRITRDIARYSSNFTPPDSIPAITPNGYRIYDDVLGDIFTNGGSGVQVLDTGGPFGNPCLFFDGNSYLSFPYHGYNDLFDGNKGFTLEFWFNSSRMSALDGSSNRSALIFELGWPSSGSWGNTFAVSTSSLSGSYESHIIVTSSDSLGVANTHQLRKKIQRGKWYHFAMCRENETSGYKYYLNGKLVPTQSIYKSREKWTMNSSYSGKLGSLQYSGYNRYFWGYLADLRISRPCRYMGDFVVPTVDLGTLDTLLSETSLLIHFDETDLDSSNFLNDWLGHTTAITGNPCNSSITPFNQGTSVYLDGSTYITVTTDSRLDISTGDFTIEFWMRPAVLSGNQALFAYRPGATTQGIWIGLQSGTPTQIAMYFGDSNTSVWEIYNAIGTTVLQVNNWYHVAVVKSGTNYQMFINGTPVAQAAYTGAGVPYITGNLYIGADSNPTNYFTGWIDDLRVTKGVARYFSMFTDKNAFVDGTVLLAHFNGANASTAFFDDSFTTTLSAGGSPTLSTAQAKFGQSSLYIASNSYAQTQTLSQFDVSIAPLTIECWLYPTSFRGSDLNRYIMVGANSGSNSLQLAVQNTGNGRIMIGRAQNGIQGVVTLDNVGVAPLNTWTHVAFVMETATDWRTYINGVLMGYQAGCTTPTSGPNYISIGSDPAGYYFQGYMDEVRMTAGVARYSSNITAPTAQFGDTVNDDPNYNNVSILLHFNGSNGSTTFTDNSTNGWSITANGNAQISTTQSKFGSSSGYFDGSGDYLSSASWSSAGNFGTNDFTIECWVYATGAPQSNQLIWSCEIYPNSTGIFLRYSSTALQLVNGSTNIITSSFSLNQWTHIAVSRYNGVVRMYVNGTCAGIYPLSGTLTDGLQYIGRPSDTANYMMQGYIDDFRITKNFSRYNGVAFIPQTTQFMPLVSDSSTKLLMHFCGANLSTSFIDEMGHTITSGGNVTISTSSYKYGASSGYFNGVTGSYLQIASTSDFGFGTDDFTIECWFYRTEAGSNNAILFEFRNVANECGVFYMSGTSRLLCFYDGATTLGNTGSAPPLNTWAHIAFSKVSGTLYCFLNGVLQWSAVQSTSFGSSRYLRIGADYALVALLTGYMQEVRINKGVGKYSSSWGGITGTFPSAPLAPGSSDSNWSQTGLLMNMDNAPQIIDEFLNHNFTVKGYVQTSSTQSQFGGFSAYFGGSGIAYTPNAEDLNLSEDFTIEGWIYPTKVTGTQIIVTKGRNAATNYPSYEVSLNGTSIQFSAYSADGVGNSIFNGQTFGTVTQNSWQHFAVCRSGSAWRGFLGGVLGWTGSSASTPYNSTSLALVLGGDIPLTLTSCYTGYIDEFRITKGVARYSSTFTPPASSFSNMGGGDSIGYSYLGHHLRFNGSTFVDERGAPVTMVGTVILSSTNSQFGGVSASFSGTAGNCLTIPNSSSNTLESGDFTIECWINRNRTSTREGICGNRPSVGGQGWVWHIQADNTLRFYFTGGSTVASTGTVESIGTWYHVAVTRTGNTITHYINGAPSGSGTVSNGTASSSVFIIGDEDGSYATPFGGYIDDFRLTKGFCRYNGTFSIPTSPHPIYVGDPWLDKLQFAAPLTGRSSTTAYIDKSLSQFPLTATSMTYSNTVGRFLSWGGAAYFNGTSSKITFVYPSGGADNVLLDFRYDFTCEVWIYLTAYNGSSCYVYSIDGSSGSHLSHTLGINSTGKVAVGIASDSSPTSGSVVTSTSSISLNTWTHIAATKRGNAILIFLNGVLDTTGVSTVYPRRPEIGRTHYIGCYYTSTSYLSGYMQDLRFYSAAKYLGNFTPPQMLQSTVAGSYPVLQMRFEGADNSTSFFDDIGHPLTVSGSSSISTDAAQFGSSSALFTGISDYLSIGSYLNDFTFYNDDFSVDFWIKTTSSTASAATIYNQPHPSGVTVSLSFSSSGALQACVGNADYDTVTVGSYTKASFLSAFHHVNLTKRDNYFTVYVDGVAQVTHSIQTDTTPKSLNVLHLHFNGTHGSTTFTTVDSYASSKTITPTNATISTTQSKFGGSSGYFNGTGYLTGSTSGSEWQFNGDFTIEFWAYIAGNGSVDGNGNYHSEIIRMGTGGQGFELILTGDSTHTGTGVEVWSLTSSCDLVAAYFTITQQTWHHYAIVRKGFYFFIFFDGVCVGVNYSTSTVNAGVTAFTIGYNNNSGWYRYFNGYLDEFRITNGVARYIGNFTPPTSAFVDMTTGGEISLLGQPSNITIGGFEGYLDNLSVYRGSAPVKRFASIPTSTIPKNSFDAIDIGYDQVATRNYGVLMASNTIPLYLNQVGGAYKTGTNAAFFNGGSYLSYRRSYDDWLGDSDWTIELWILPCDSNITRGILTNRSGSYYCSFLIQRDSSGYIQFYASTTGNSWTQITLGRANTGSWSHIAICRKVTNIYAFFNGALVSITSFSGSLYPWNNPYFAIGTDATIASFLGFIDGFQFIKGFAKYTSSFIPSTALQTAVAIDFYRSYFVFGGTPIISYYEMNDTSSTLADATGNYPLTILNPSSVTTQTALTPMNVGLDNALLFNGTYADSTFKNLTKTSGLAFSFFINTTASEGTILQKQVSVSIEIYQSKIRFAVVTSLGPVSLTSSRAISDGNAHYVVCDFTDGVLSIYIDGVLDSTTPTTSFALVGNNILADIPYDANYSDVLLQMKLGDLIDDIGNPITIYGNNATFLKVSPFNNYCIVFDGTYHIEAQGIQFGMTKGLNAYSSTGAFDFTIEFWLNIIKYPTSDTSIIGSGCTGSGSGSITGLRGGLFVFLRTTGALGIEAGNLSSGGAQSFYYRATTTSIPTSTWTHVTVTCYRNNPKVYFNGSIQPIGWINYSSYPNSSFINCNINTTDPLIIGGAGFNKGGTSGGTSSPTRISNIMMSDLRITKSATVYPLPNFYIPVTPYASDSYTSILLHLDGALGSTSIVDSSSNAMTPTANGNAKLTTVSYAYGISSLSLDGTNSSISIPYNSALSFGTGDFSIECWIYLTASQGGSNRTLYDGRSATNTNGLWVYKTSSSGLQVFVGGSVILTGQFNSTGSWAHIVISRLNGNMSLYENGQLLGNVSYSLAINIDNIVYIGQSYDSSTWFQGYIDEFRISKGVSRYSPNFYPPQAAMSTITNSKLLSDASFEVMNFGLPSVTLGSTKINRTHLSLNGTTDYLMTIDAQLAGTFTVDCWVWLKSISSNEQPIISQTSGSDVANTSLGIKNRFLQISNNGSEVVGSTQITANTWHHIAFVRSGTSCIGYLDGTAEVNHLSFVDPVKAATQIGARAGTYFLNANFDAFRIRYEQSWTSSFTPPTQSSYIADTNWDDVMLLLVGNSITSAVDPYANNVSMQQRFSGYNGATVLPIWDDANQYGWTTAGNASIVNSHFRNLYPSIQFDGIANAIKVTNSTALSFSGLTTFTLEWWAYIPDFSVKRCWFDKRVDATNTGVYIYQYTDSKLYVNFGDSSGTYAVQITSGTFSTGWHHFAIVRNAANSNSWMLYIDGTQSGSTVNSSVTVSDASDLLIGRNLSYGEYFKGAMAEIQLNKLAKYTTSFTAPSTLALDPIAYENDYTVLLLHFEGTSGTFDFVDSSRYNLSLKGSYGAQLSSAQSKFGSTSLLLSGAQYCGVIVEPTELLNIGIGDFTIECWFRMTSGVTNSVLLASWQGGLPGPWWALQFSSSSVLSFWYSPYSYGSTLLSSTSLSTGTWYHVAVTRENDNFIMWLNGTPVSRATCDSAYSRGYKIREERDHEISLGIGGYFMNSNPPYYFGGGGGVGYNGYIDEVRIVKGKAMYQGAFSVPTAPYQLSTSYPVRDLNQSLFIDANSSTYSVQEKSALRNTITTEGTMICGVPVGGCYASFTSNASGFRNNSGNIGDVACGTDDFTLDYWVYQINGGYNGQSWGRQIATEVINSPGGFCAVSGNNGSSSPCGVLFHDSDTGSFIFSSTTPTLANATWNHVAFTRQNGVFMTWLNGTPSSRTMMENPFDIFKKYSGSALSNSNKTCSSSTYSTLAKSGFSAQNAPGVYWEFLISATGGSVGIADSTFNYGGVILGGVGANSWGVRSSDGFKGYSNAFTSYMGSGWSNNDVIGVAVKGGNIWFSRNGTWAASGNPATGANPAFTGITGLVYPAVSTGGIYVLRTAITEFSYPMPAGFRQLREMSTVSFVKNTISIGCNNNGSESFYGYLQNMRFTRGVNRFSPNWVTAQLSGDTYSSQVTLLLNCEGSNGGQVFTDSSTSGKSVSFNGSVNTTTSDKKFGGTSAYFNGSTDYLSIAQSSDWNYGTNAFTIEMWVKFAGMPYATGITTGSMCLLSQRFDASNYIALVADKTGIIFEAKSGGSTIVSYTATTLLDMSNWHHIAVCRSGNTFTTYFDGVAIGSTSASGTMPSLSAPLVIGYNSGVGYYFTGWVDDVRLTNGAARYPSGFPYVQVPVTLQPLPRKFLGTSPMKWRPIGTQTINSPISKFDIGFSTMAFDGTAAGTHDWETANDYALILNKNDFTFEAWVNPQASGADRYLYAHGVNTAGGIQFAVSTSSVNFRMNSSTNMYATVSISGWTHVAYQRQGNTNQIFVNGALVAEAALSDYDQSDYSVYSYIGASGGSASDTYRYYGYVDGVRLTRGVARYANSSTPYQIQTSAFSSDGNTALLMHFEGTQGSTTFTDSSSNGFTASLTGTGYISTAQSKFGSSSLYLDGSTGYLSIPFNSAFEFSTNDFTVEAWVYPTNLSGTYGIIGCGSNGVSGWDILLNSTGQIAIQAASAGTIVTSLSSNQVVTANQWNHVAVMRKSGFFYIFVNGALTGSGGYSTAYNLNTTSYPVRIGVGRSGTGFFPGYIDEIRVSSGLSRFARIQSFTPPTTQFPTSKFVTPANLKTQLFFDATTLQASLPPGFLTMGSPQVIRASSTNSSGSCWFNGDDQFTMFHQATAVVSEDFTLEFWMETHQYGTHTLPVWIWGQANALTDTNRLALCLRSNVLQLQYGNNTSGTVFNLGVVPLYTMTHIAITRQSGTLRVFVNGTLCLTTYLPTIVAGTQSLGLLVDDNISSSENRFRGYIKNFRFLRNICSYTSNFTPNTTLAPFTDSVASYLIDPGFDLQIGNFVGSLDDFGIIQGSVSESFVKRAYDMANLLTYTTTRDTTIDTQISGRTSNDQRFGTGRIYGYVRDQSGNPLCKKVVLVEYWSFLPIRETESDSLTGYYEFTNLNTVTPYSVIAEDSLDYRYNDIIRAKVHAEIE